jgi:hypothetical protein
VRCVAAAQSQPTLNVTNCVDKAHEGKAFKCVVLFFAFWAAGQKGLLLFAGGGGLCDKGGGSPQLLA